MRKAVEFSPTSATLGRFFWAVASIRVRPMCNLSSEKMRLLFECGFYTRLYGIQSLLAAGAVWLNLGPPPQPEGRRPKGCRGRPRCSQTAPATRKDCVYHDGTKNSTPTGKPRRNRTQREAFWTRKNGRNLHSGFSHVRLQISALGQKFAISHGSNQLIRCWQRKFQSKGQGKMAESRNVRLSIWLVCAMVTDTWHTGMITCILLWVKNRYTFSATNIPPWHSQQLAHACLKFPSEIVSLSLSNPIYMSGLGRNGTSEPRTTDRTLPEDKCRDNARPRPWFWWSSLSDLPSKRAHLARSVSCFWSRGLPSVGIRTWSAETSTFYSRQALSLRESSQTMISAAISSIAFTLDTFCLFILSKYPNSPSLGRLWHEAFRPTLDG